MSAMLISSFVFPAYSQIESETEGHEPVSFVYGQPADVSFYRDAEMTDEYENVSDIKKGDRIWYKIVPQEGYLCVEFKVDFVIKAMREKITPSDGVVAAISGEEFEWTAYTRLKGDVNGDGSLNAKDVTTFMKSLTNQETARKYLSDNPVADVKSDGKFNAKDITLLMKYIAGYKVELCANKAPRVDCLVRTDALLFVEGRDSRPYIAGYADLTAYLQANNSNVPQYLTQEYWDSHSIEVEWVYAEVPLEDDSTFPQLRFYGQGSGVSYFEAELRNDIDKETKAGYILYLVYYD